MDTRTLTLVDGSRIVVPNDLTLITPYVLTEQQDWFEDEIRFLRELLQPGDQVLDIGANHGVYTLSMAKAIGPVGHVWAFEPASSTAALLQQSLALNPLHNVTLVRCALSAQSGEATLSLHEQSELNTLTPHTGNGGPSETVPVSTLDEQLALHHWRNIQFIKMDAEGEEENILRGAQHFFATQSPLVMYEIKAGDQVNLSLIRAFDDLGYHAYQLVPDLGILVPFDLHEEPDSYALNLFCCKEDCANRLVQQNRLLTSSQIQTGTVTAATHDVRYHWQHTWATLPYGNLLRRFWDEQATVGLDTTVTSALAQYAISRDAQQPLLQRFLALRSSLQQLRTACTQPTEFMRLASLARTAQGMGHRAEAVTALSQLADQLLQQQHCNLDEPFLPPSERFDTLSPQGDIIRWTHTAVLETLEQLWAYSSFYTGVSTLERLHTIRDLGLASDMMQRRLALIEQRMAGITRLP